MPSLGNLSPQAGIALGILVGLVSTSVQSLGLTLQRKSHILEDEKTPEEYRRPPYRRRRWQLGMSMFIFSNLAGSSIQITTLPLPVLSTLQASGLVFNTVCATLILGEPFTRYSFVGTILVCAGAVLIAIFGAIGEPAHSLEQLLQLLGRRQFITWIVCTGILVLLIVAVAKSIKYIWPHAKNNPLVRLFRGMSYGAASGILSAHALLVAKSAVELIVRTVADGDNQFRHWQAWVILLCLLGLALLQLYYLHRGLRLCSTSILYPFVFCIYNIIAILDGLIYFDQIGQLSLLHALLVALGTVVLLVGVFALSWRLNLDPPAHPPVGQNPLAPGMGFVGDDGESETSALIPARTFSDEENGLHVKEIAVADDDDKAGEDDEEIAAGSLRNGLKLPRLRSSDMATDRAAILEELADDTTSIMSPHLPMRRSSLRSMSASTAKRNSRARFDLPPALEAVEDGDPDEPDGTRPLLHRTNTGRFYRDKPLRLLTSEDSRVKGRRRRSVSSQKSSSGWWRLHWWKDDSSAKPSKGKARADQPSPAVSYGSQGN